MTAESPSRPRPAVLCILDGWGWRNEKNDNAIACAHAPNYEALLKGPHALLSTSGRAVGLPAGQMGNSEVGHMNIGSGRVVTQDLPRIDDAIANGSLGHGKALTDLIARAGRANGRVHVLGLVSPGGVHSHQDHISALVRILVEHGLHVWIHAFLDGRDTAPKSAAGFVAKFERDIAGCSQAAIVTVSGRYYAMDRDKRWDRVEKAYQTIVEGEGTQFACALDAIESSYAAGTSDEFVLPCRIGAYPGMADGDALLFANFRADRARELCAAILDPSFEGFPRNRLRALAAAASLTEYSAKLNAFMSVLIPPEDISETLGQYIAELGMKQLRIAETEKYAHVTFFLNGGREEKFPGEDRILVPSPKVATYDRQPEMSALKVMDELDKAVGSGKYDLIVVNFANPDMVGHTGIMKAAVKAVETIDVCLGRLTESVRKAGGVLLITADHGNVEMMKNPDTGEPHTAHTTFDVPVIVANAGRRLRLANGTLADVAPTLLDLMGLAKPHAMSGRSLLRCEPAESAA